MQGRNIYNVQEDDSSGDEQIVPLIEVDKQQSNTTQSVTNIHQRNATAQKLG